MCLSKILYCTFVLTLLLILMMKNTYIQVARVIRILFIK